MSHTCTIIYQPFLCSPGQLSQWFPEHYVEAFENCWSSFSAADTKSLDVSLLVTALHCIFQCSAFVNTHTRQYMLKLSRFDWPTWFELLWSIVHYTTCISLHQSLSRIATCIFRQLYCCMSPPGLSSKWSLVMLLLCDLVTPIRYRAYLAILSSFLLHVYPNQLHVFLLSCTNTSPCSVFFWNFYCRVFLCDVSVYSGNVLDAFLAKIPKSPVRELLEMEPETAKFEWVLELPS